MNYNEMIKFCRKAAKDQGLVFKKYNNYKLNNSSAFYFCDRKTRQAVRTSLTLNTAFNIACSGEIIL